jgi:glycosyltransferase involved in cell wall biosynthesis
VLIVIISKGTKIEKCINMTERIDIVLTTYNRIEFTKKSIQYLKERTKTPYRLIVVDNNSNDGSQEMLYNLKQNDLISHLILLEENYGIHMAKNYGLSLVRSEPYYIDTDNDLLCPKLDPDWINRLTTLMDNFPSFGAISCRPQVLVGRGGHEFDGPEEVVKFNHLGAHLRIMRTEVVRRVGGWEKTWTANRNHEDKWISEKLKNEGLDVGYAKNVRCFHQFGTNWGYKDIPIEKHGHNPMWPPSEHWDTIINQFNQDTWETI